MAGASGSASTGRPSHVTNGWDDPVDGWQFQPAYNSSYGDKNGKSLYDNASNRSGSSSKARSRKGNSMNRQDSGSPQSGRGGGRQGSNRNNGGSERSPGQGEAGRGGRGGRGRRGEGRGGRGKFNGGRGEFNGERGASNKPQGGWGQHNNFRQYEAAPNADYGGRGGWDGQGPLLSPENGWQQVSSKSRNGSESSSRSGAPGITNKAWHQGAKASTQLVSGSSSNLYQQGDTGTDLALEYPASPYSDSQCSDLDHVEDDSDDGFFSDDSFAQESHEDQKKIKWFRDFFQDLDSMTDAQLNEHDRQWHCPACKGGPGAIDWFRGLVPLATHARTMRSRRVKLHRKFAEILEEELRIRRSAQPNVELQSTFGKWNGLSEDTESQQKMIIWPPILVIQNTQLEQDDEGKWIGMGNKELVDMFKDYNPLKPRHAYGPQGHRGMSLLIFPDSPIGYHDAVRLATHFANSRRGRDDWQRPGKILFKPGGERILYGYLAIKDDLDIFNRHSRGKTLLKYELRKLQQVVLEPMQRMEQQNQLIQSLQIEQNTLKKSVSETSKNLQLREEELQILWDRQGKQHAENKRELADMEEFFQQESAQWANEVAAKDSELQKLRDDLHKIALNQSHELNVLRSNLPNIDQDPAMANEILQMTKKVEGSLLEAEDFENKLKELEQKHHERRVQFQKQQHEAALTFEQQIKIEMTEFLHSFEKQMRQ
uniref:XS domain-containing protein n=1 Tax=Physcomitrium patens TaxID=3218 RepID=A0A2K1KJR3_PHYPA|nr:protein SUPPRESSOR OF GENE SILENCING 3 homolog isoform X3 [Physcomitrium patens]PNR54016.1 hypothetical protein PHYPA_007692 [Physcomitrium patens]|eukprot:XP_024375951.1 protein SUPPRESSOR OF GENE SILENCING 3 homolog isoform X3 [Physcomitrella patens]